MKDMTATRICKLLCMIKAFFAFEFYFNVKVPIPQNVLLDSGALQISSKGYKDSLGHCYS